MRSGFELSRRDLWLMLPAIAAAGASASEKNVLQSKAYIFKDLKTNSHPGYTGREMFEGYTHEGFRLAMHESKLEAGAMPHPAHHHQHEEMFMLREGTLEVTVSGKSWQVGPGDAVFIGSNEEHGVRNAGKIAAQYFVIELGTDK
jgi:quercetin dioxygenase-like cupin family protein